MSFSVSDGEGGPHGHAEHGTDSVATGAGPRTVCECLSFLDEVLAFIGF